MNSKPSKFTMVRIDRDLFDLIKEAAKNDRRTFKETMSQVLRERFKGKK